MSTKIAFFDIDGTLTSEVDGSLPDSAILAIRQARANGNLMFINTGRCYQNVEPRFMEIGFDGIVCGCGTNIYYGGKELMHVHQPHEVAMEILEQVRKVDADVVFESREEVLFDLSRGIRNPAAKKLYEEFKSLHYDMSHPLEAEDYTCDKFVVWYDTMAQVKELRKVTDKYFQCIDRGNNFLEFVPHGYSKATGIKYIVEHFGLDFDDAYAFGDSSNDLPMLRYVKNSVAMGNSDPASLKGEVAYVTDNASRDGIAKALKRFGFIGED